MTVRVPCAPEASAGTDGLGRALADLAAGRPIVVVDDEALESSGALVVAAERATPEVMAFVVRHTSGFVCAALDRADCDRLALTPTCPTGRDRHGTSRLVSVDADADADADADDGVGTGISAADRARTVRVLADAGSAPADLRRPGHVVPLRAEDGGVLRRPGHTEAAVDLARLAGLRPAGVLGEVVSERPGEQGMARRDELELLATDHDLQMVTVADLAAHRRRTETQVVRVTEACLPLAAATFRAVGYTDALDGAEHVALVHGEVEDGQDVPVRVHRECLTGDVFGSRRCGCGPRLRDALERVADEGHGVVLYLRPEGPGASRLHELSAYQRHDIGGAHGSTSPDAHPRANARDHDGVGAQILRELGVRSVRLLAEDPAQRSVLEGHGLPVAARADLSVASPADRTAPTCCVP
ncbi:3,4-dihydroxy-2-butanone-4-phosphate synthase [Pseudonocardia endophytica]|uniref:3,4-dihydroxy-2-butanone-4-phosphate synthase n=1 Tax=Pseudonocardia endophytica TaxID=401976 RepID=A0A4R1HI57_PSEEN|nr:3,4-dihydroxy-2-butanone-4-phosphate synthase [Pseudonocardia endophytica]TCK21927.1 3,4-dihydroxy 2-butanone 4-phosphate synthase/GTP cyclohydrolase II [Pseudonocardia endophytica]